MGKREMSLEHILREPTISIKKIIEVIDSDQGNDIINQLFLFFYNSLDQYSGEKNLDYLVRGVKLIPLIIENYPDIKTKSLRKRYRKIQDKIEQVKEENVPKCIDPSNAINELKKVKKTVSSLENKPYYRKENKHYKFLELIIFDLKNIKYLEETLECIPDIVNIKNKEDYTIFSKIVEKILKEIEREKISLEEISYYSNVLTLMSNKDNFNLPKKDRKFCFSKIKKTLQDLSAKESASTEILDMITNINSLLDKQKQIPIEKLLQEYNISINFNQRALEELHKHQKKAKRKEVKNRIKYDDYIITIDGPTAIEIDDGLSIRKLENGNYLVGVHIANVLGYLPYHSLSVQEAFFKGTSIYNINSLGKNSEFNNVIPILPYEFSAKNASLLENKPRFAISHIYEIDKTGEIVDFTYEKTLIKSSKKCTYQEIDLIAEHGSPNKQLEQTVHLLNELTYKLAEKDHSKPIYLDVKKVNIDSSKLKVGNENVSERIVNQLMKLTNSNKADYFAHLGYPCLYRVHQIKNTDAEKLERAIKDLSTIQENEKFNQLYSSLLSIYPKPYYDLSGSHEGLNIKHYCHGTSPLRRAADIGIEHALDICYFQIPTDKMLYELEDELRQKKDIINAKNKNIDDFMMRWRAEKEKIKTNSYRNNKY